MVVWSFGEVSTTVICEREQSLNKIEIPDPPDDSTETPGPQVDDHLPRIHREVIIT